MISLGIPASLAIETELSLTLHLVYGICCCLTSEHRKILQSSNNTSKLTSSNKHCKSWTFDLGFATDALEWHLLSDTVTYYILPPKEKSASPTRKKSAKKISKVAEKTPTKGESKVVLKEPKAEKDTTDKSGRKFFP